MRIVKAPLQSSRIQPVLSGTTDRQGRSHEERRRRGTHDRMDTISCLGTLRRARAEAARKRRCHRLAGRGYIRGSASRRYQLNLWTARTEHGRWRIAELAAYYRSVRTLLFIGRGRVGSARHRGEPLVILGRALFLGCLTCILPDVGRLSPTCSPRIVELSREIMPIRVPASVEIGYSFICYVVLLLRSHMFS